MPTPGPSTPVVEARQSRRIGLRISGSEVRILLRVYAPDGNPSLAVFASGVPAINDALLDLPGFTGPSAQFVGFICISVDAELISGSHNVAMVTAIYQRPSFSGTLQPDDGLHTETWDLSMGTVEVMFDAAGEPYRTDGEPVTFPVPQLRISMTRMLTGVGMAPILARYGLVGKLNSDTWRGIDPRNWQYGGAAIQPLQRNLFLVTESATLQLPLVPSLPSGAPAWDLDGGGGYDEYYAELNRTTSPPTAQGRTGSAVALPLSGAFAPFVRKRFLTTSFSFLPQSPVLPDA